MSSLKSAPPRIWENWRADEDLAAVADLVDVLVADNPTPESDDDPAVDGFRELLIAQGLWSVGMAESVGGGGAGLATVAVTVARLARAWPSLALGIAHAHAFGAAPVVAQRWPDVVAAAAAGGPVAYVIAPRPGTPVRVDVAAPAPVLLVVDGENSAVVQSDSPGVIHVEPFARTGLAGARSHDVHLDRGLEWSPVDAGAGGSVLHLLTGAIACGLAEGAVHVAAEYVATREQFGAPLAALPTIARAVLDARSAVAAAFDRILACAVADPTPAAATGAMAHAFTVAIPAAASAVQLLGGYGYLREYPVERAFRDLVSLRAAAGAFCAIDVAAASLYS